MRTGKATKAYIINQMKNQQPPSHFYHTCSSRLQDTRLIPSTEEWCLSLYSHLHVPLIAAIRLYDCILLVGKSLSFKLKTYGVKEAFILVFKHIIIALPFFVQSQILWPQISLSKSRRFEALFFYAYL